MKCFKCGQALPEDSEFCQYCGNKIEVLAESVLYKESDTVNAAETSLKERMPKNKMILGAVVAVIIVLIGLNIYQFTSATVLKDEINTLNKKMESLNTQLDEKQESVDTYLDKYLVSNVKAEKYDKIVEFLTSSKAGYASNNFYASDKILVLKNGKANIIDITCKYPATINSYWSDSNISGEWISSRNNYTSYMMIEAKSKGIGMVKFANDVNNESFEVMVVVI